MAGDAIRDVEWFRQTLDALGDDEFAALDVLRERALADSVPKQVQALYLFGQMPENEGEVLDRAARLFNWECTNCVCVPEQHGRGNPSHAQRWIDALVERSLWVEDIVVVPAEDTGEPNTQTECVAFLQVCQEMGWDQVGVMAAAFHQARAFHTMVSEIVRRRLGIKVYSIPAPSRNWNQIVTHSNGRLAGTRAQMIWPERFKMGSYQNLIPPSEALAYLDARDR